MSVSDPISDMLTRIRNAVLSGNTLTAMPSSKLKVAIAKILEQEGFIEGYEEADSESNAHKVLRIRLKYVGERRKRRPVIEGIERISRPGCRVYAKKREIPWVLSGLGIAIISTSKGVVSDRQARRLGMGGEVLCKVW